MTAGVLAALAVLLLAAGRRPTPRRRAEPPTRRSRELDRTARSARGERRPVVRRHTRRPASVQWDRFLDAVAGEVRGGATLRQATLTAAAAACPDHALADDGTDLRHPPHTADPAEAVVLQTLATAAELGGATAATVQAGANLLRERAAVRAEASAHSAQARLSARVLTAVPIVFATWSAVASGSFRRALAAPPGMAAAAAGVVTNLVGWWWMRRIVRAAST